MQEEAHDEVNQEIPRVPTAPAVSVETKTLLQHMAAMIAGAFQAQQQQPMVPPLRSLETHSLREFVQLKPPTFSGETDPLVTESWLKQVARVLDHMPVTDSVVRVLLVTFQLKGLAKLW